MTVLRRWSAAALLSLSLFAGAHAATTSVEMLREMFRRPVTEWQQHLKANSRLLNDEFFSNVEKRMRWGIENNHVDDAFRFAMVGDFAAEAANKPANFRIDLADLFFKAENSLMAGQIVDNIIISSPNSEAAYRALFIRGQLKEMSKDLVGAYGDFIEMTQNSRYRSLADQAYLRAAKISLFVTNMPRAKEELQKAAALGNVEAKEISARIQAEEGQNWDAIPPLPNAPGEPNTMPNTNTMTSNPTANPTIPPTVSPVLSIDELRGQARLAEADGRLPDAISIYQQILVQAPGDLAVVKSLAALFYRSGQLVHAKNLLTETLGANPQDVDLLRFRGNVLERLYDREGDKQNLALALADYRLAASLDPSHQMLSWEVSRAEAKKD